MTILESLIQGIVQGATEFLPVSSSGHLSIAQHVLGVEIDSLLFDVLLHLGTLAAVLAVYYKLVIRLIRAFCLMVADIFRGKFKWSEMDHDRRLVMMLIIGLVPLFLLFLPIPGTGMNLKDLSELWASDSNIWVEGFAFLCTSALLFLGIRAARGHKTYIRRGKNGVTQEVSGRSKFNVIDSVVIGVTQCAAAVFPGLSRSGSTLSAGLMRGINRQAALDYSFVLGIPSIMAAAVLTIHDAVGQPVDIGVGAMIVGVLSSAIVGFLAIKLLRWIVATDKLEIFAIYTLVLGVVTIIIAIIETATGTNLFTDKPL